MRKTSCVTLALAAAAALAVPRPAQASLLEIWGDAGLGTFNQGGSFNDSNPPRDFYKDNGGYQSQASYDGVDNVLLAGYLSEHMSYGVLTDGPVKLGVDFGATLDVNVIQIFFSVDGGSGTPDDDSKRVAVFYAEAQAHF